jgi:hypothetical protein
MKRRWREDEAMSCLFRKSFISLMRTKRSSPNILAVLMSVDRQPELVATELPTHIFKVSDGWIDMRRPTHRPHPNKEAVEVARSLFEPGTPIPPPNPIETQIVREPANNSIESFTVDSYEDWDLSSHWDDIGP